MTSSAVLLYAPLALLGASAGALHVLSRAARDPRRRRILQIAWILTLLVGVPLWLFVAATIG